MKKPKVLTEYQKKFIEDNFKTMSYSEIGHHLGLRADWLKLYASKNGLIKKPRRKIEVVETDNGFFNVNQIHSWL